ncbi:MAG TPA: amino acid adenylation domain-containing protein [Ktedonobacteraceae bacterium]|jgi:amino acid adenylation domain-containing protein/non-ribosomal peptide synthase protein (TIGR01720 family)
MSTRESTGQFNDIAIIGMAGRFPKAKDLDAFWQLLHDGAEGISFFSSDELRAVGVQDRLLHDPAYIKAGAVLEDIEYFDAHFFDYPPKIAQLMNPQQRLFLECAWQALENAGYNPATYQGAIGVYAGSSRNSYLSRIRTHPHDQQATDPLQALIVNDKDFVAPLVSYKLDLRGPSINVQTACSTSLVAVHLACQSLLAGECDLALAGGVSVRFLNKNGYLYREGGIASPDGHCRAFDVRAQGTVSGDGVGIVVLKRLVNALEERDTISAIIKGSAINNDGALKVGYTAPGIQGQAAVIAEAHSVADVEPETISYIEAHGTGTALGDPIEIAALTQAFGQQIQKNQFCALGSVKSNIGHLDAAAGIAGLIKSVLALTHRMLPPTLHYTHPPADIDLARSPFYVNSTLTEWKTDQHPRRAGVSSFGIGGTNAHVILEESAAPEPSHSSRPQHLVLLSARTDSALEKATQNLLSYMQQHQELALGDISYTLQVGRKDFRYRKALVCATADSAIQEFANPASKRVLTALHKPLHRSVIFLFPGQGTPVVSLAHTIYRFEPLFRQQIDMCATFLRPLLGLDLRTLLFPAEEDRAQAEQALGQTALAQPALFAVEYALAKLWMSWGIVPSAMIGYSLGEYVAACLAGVFSLEEALGLLVTRGQLMQSLPQGSMLAVSLTEAEIAAYGGEHIALAAVNAPARCVVAGRSEKIAELEQRLVRQGVACQLLHTSHAFHSSMMEPVLAQFTRLMSSIRLQPPQIPYISNLTGTWISATQARDPAYWASHLRQCVRFAAGLGELLQERGGIFLEVGPGHTLSTLVRQQPARDATQPALASFQHTPAEEEHLLHTVAQLWLAGVALNWEQFHAHERCRRVPLPAYPFERRRYWLESTASPDPVAAPQQRAQRQDASGPEGHAPEMAAKKDEAMQTRHLHQIAAKLAGILSHALGIQPEEIDGQASFFELGADSLALLQVSQSIQETFGVKVGFRLLLDRYAALDTLAAHIGDLLPPLVPAASAPVPVAPLASVEDQAQTPALAERSLERLFAQQLQVMSEQLHLLSATLGQAAPDLSRLPSLPARERTQKAAPPQMQREPLLPATNTASDLQTGAPTLSQQIDPEVFVPYRSAQQKRGARALSARQQAHLETLIRRLGERTGTSKSMAQTARPFLADSRATFGFTLPFKELVYPIVVERAAGARVWDVDGNQYVDLAMGFGALLFGHSPAFLLAALEAQAQHGLQLGMQSNLVGKVAQLLHELTGVERVAFCNSGTEAVMSALRLARAATGRTKIAIFAGSFHGTFDGVLMRSREMAAGGLEAAPLAPGVPESIIGDVIALRFDAPESLETLQAHMHELAAVLVEPPQSRRPDLQPVAFIRALRELTAAAGVALIFDEVVTGFRTHPGGAQALMNIQADLVIYGKALGAGLPIGVVGGRAAYMDFIDGGMWQYGDESYPQSEQTFFAGTYFKHPLIMAGIWAVLTHLKAQGPQLQQQLNQRVRVLVESLNTYFEQAQISIRVVHYGSIFRFVFPPALKRVEESLFFYHLLESGIYCGEGRNCFLSTAHTQEDVQQIIRAVGESIDALRAGGFLLDPGPEQAFAPTTDRCQVNGSAQQSYPLTEQQKELWVLAHMDQEASRAYNEPLLLRLSGPLDVPALTEAFQLLLARHEALRVTFSPDGAWQKVAPVLRIEVPLVDFSHREEQEREQVITDWLVDEIGRPFDLQRGPLLRASVGKRADQQHVLLLVCHHSIVDGASTGTICQELSTLYSAISRRSAYRLAEPTAYGTFIHWQRQQQEVQRPQAQAYWQTFFAHPHPPLELPADHRRPPIKTYNAARCSLSIEASLAARLKAVSVRLKATLFLTLLAAYTAWLHRLSGQDELIVGTAVAGQAVAGGTHLVGHCVNLLPLRSALAKDQTFATYLGSLQKNFLDVYDHQAFPYMQMMRGLKSARDPGRFPLINTAFNLDSAGDLPFASLETEILRPPLCFAKFDLDMNITAKDGELLIDCIYNTDLFEARTIRRWLQHFRVLLDALATDPEQRVQALPLLTAQERATLLRAWNTSGVSFPEMACLHTLFEAQMARTPDAVAVVFEERQLTYQELNQRANRLAHALCRQGIGPDDLVGLCIDRSVEMLVGLLGILKAGGGYVPLDPDYPPERLAFLLQDSGVSMLLTHTRLRSILSTYAGPLLCLDADWQRLQEESAENPPGSASLEQRAYVMYTSGSTGQPKGVMVSHRAIANRLLWAHHAGALTREDRLLQTASLSFDISLWELLGPLCAGACVVLLRSNDLLEIPALVDLLLTQQISVVHAVPSLLHILVEQTAFRNCTTLRRVYTGGEAVPASLLRRLFACLDADLQLFYGPTEAAINATAWQCPRSGQIQQVSLGPPVANMQVYVFDEYLQPVPPGLPGELYIAGVGLSRGYVGRPALTAERFLPHPFAREAGERLYRTGDLARYLPDGQLEFLGRRDQQVKIRGHRIELHEIETVLSGHPAVDMAVVLMREDRPGDRRLVAYLRLHPGQVLTARQIHTFAARKLPAFMLPSLFQFVEAFAQTPHGKIDRRTLLSLPIEDSLAARSAYVPPQSSVERRLQQIWSEVLPAANIGIQDNFFELGGDSILGLRIITKANEAGLHLTTKHIFQQQTIAELAQVVGTSSVQAEQTVTGDTAPLTPIQQAFFALNLFEPQHFNQALLLVVQRPLKLAWFVRALHHCLLHHDALRLRFSRGPTGWVQHCATSAGALPLLCIDLSALPAHLQRQALAARAAEIHAGLNLEHGPLLRAVHFSLGEKTPARVLIVIHHLAIDIVSWSILLSDLQTAYLQQEQGESVHLPRKTTSFVQWARRLQAYARSSRLQAELPYWLSEERARVHPLPTRVPAGANTVSSEQMVAVGLGSAQTKDLLSLVPKMYQMQAHDVLLTALALALAGWSGERLILIDVERHGREQILDDVQLTRTVGWFTSLAPVLLDLRKSDRPEEVLKRVKEQLQLLPDGGIGYGLLRYMAAESSTREKLQALPQAQVVFNYLGRSSQMVPQDALFVSDSASAGPPRSLSGLRSYLLDIEAIVRGECLDIHCRYSTHVHDRASIEQLAQSITRFLQVLIEHCQIVREKGSEPADFLQTTLDRRSLEAILSQVRFGDDE